MYRGDPGPTPIHKLLPRPSFFNVVIYSTKSLNFTIGFLPNIIKKGIPPSPNEKSRCLDNIERYDLLENFQKNEFQNQEPVELNLPCDGCIMNTFSCMDLS